ncbi:MAG: glutamine amidotransferase, partial [Planctomycetales bacterium]|nr:glutamine amidotransferase [Planctomycetales bacterium]
HTAYAPQVEVQEAGRKLRDDFAAPLYTVPFGPAADAASARDVAVERLDEQFTVFVKNELQVKGLIRIRGYVKKDIPVELELVDSMGQKQALGKKSIRADEDGRQVEVAFTFTPQLPGHYRLYMKAETQLGELVAKNNELSAYLTVLEGGLRVLYLDGEKWHEQRFLRASLNASPDIELDDRIIDRRNKQKIDITEEVRKGRYDAFILRDLDARLLTPESLQLLADQVGKGKGLLMLGGDPGSFGFGHYQETPLGAALPIEFDELEGKPNLGAGRDRFFLNGPLPMIPVGSHPLTRLAPDAENKAAWQKLPPLKWAHKFKDVKEGPGVRILLETPKQEPLLVSGEFGSGRVLAFAGESTYLWPMHGFEKEHKRFWRQVVLWLVKRDDLNKDDVWIKLDQRRFNPGSRVIITTGARTSTGDVVTGATVETIVLLPSKKQQPLKLTKDKDGNFTGSLEVTEPGDYSVETAATAGGKPLGKARAEFMVFDRDVELSNPAADPDQLASLAAWTKQDGGKLVQPEQFSSLLDELAAKPPEFEERQIKWKLGSTPADAWPLFLLLTGLLSVEWFLRKKWGLV